MNSATKWVALEAAFGVHEIEMVSEISKVDSSLVVAVALGNGLDVG